MAESDASLVSRAMAGSERACVELVRRYERAVYGLIVRMARDPGAAEDLAQDTFVKALGRLDTYDPRQKFSNWLLKIAHNTAIDHLRRRRPDTVPLDVGNPDDPAGSLAAPAVDSPAAATERRELAEAIESAIAGLRPEYREAVVLRYQEGLTCDEIAGITGLPVGTVKTYLHRARKELAARLAADGWGLG